MVHIPSQYHPPRTVLVASAISQKPSISKRYEQDTNNPMNLYASIINPSGPHGQYVQPKQQIKQKQVQVHEQARNMGSGGIENYLLMQKAKLCV
jgi:hypothetical protein